MKKIIYIFLFLFAFNISNAQYSDNQNLLSEDIEYPQYYAKDSINYVIFTVEQAQSIDNKLELLSVLEEIVSNYKDGQDMYLYLIDKYEQKIVAKEKLIEEYIGKNEDKATIIANLKDVISKMEVKLAKREQIEKNLESIIEEKDEEIENLKKQRRLIIGGAIVVVVLAILIS